MGPYVFGKLLLASRLFGNRGVIIVRFSDVDRFVNRRGMKQYTEPQTKRFAFLDDNLALLPFR